MAVQWKSGFVSNGDAMKELAVLTIAGARLLPLDPSCLQSGLEKPSQAPCSPSSIISPSHLEIASPKTRFDVYKKNAEIRGLPPLENPDVLQFWFRRSIHARASDCSYYKIKINANLELALTIPI
jgi:hypothetical protein